MCYGRSREEGVLGRSRWFFVCREMKVERVRLSEFV